jgi:hypothetical protein
MKYKLRITKNKTLCSERIVETQQKCQRSKSHSATFSHSKYILSIYCGLGS